LRVQWFGQSAFLLTDAAGRAVVLDPFGVPGPEMAARGMRFAYPPIQGVKADLVLITHEHFDHAAAEVVGGSPRVIRSTAGSWDTPIGPVVAVASEHDDVAGTRRGPNAIYAFTLDGLRVCHFGDFGQRALRPEQAEVLRGVDLLFLPVGGGPTIGAAGALAIVRELAPRWVVPMHYRTPAISFLEPADTFLAGCAQVLRCQTPVFSTADLPATAAAPVAVVPAAPA
jgi:L-ascorbate metabolism protein UlaG (beta-lactamase superfamily)